jgi:hypothetical protein
MPFACSPRCAVGFHEVGVLYPHHPPALFSKYSTRIWLKGSGCSRTSSALAGTLAIADHLAASRVNRWMICPIHHRHVGRTMPHPCEGTSHLQRQAATVGRSQPLEPLEPLERLNRLNR